MVSSRVQEFANRFREQIHAGVYLPGDQLPRAADVAAEHGVSKGLIQDAYARLRDEGLVETRPRHGTFVTDPSRDQLPWTNLVQRDSAGYVFGATSLTWSVLKDFGSRTTSAPPGIDTFLNLDPRTDVVINEQLLGLPADRTAGRRKQEPIQLVATFLPAWIVEACPALTQDDIPRSIPALIEESIGGPISWTAHIGSEPASQSDAGHLQVTPGSPAIRIFTVGALPDGRPAEVTVRTLSGQRFQLGPLPLVRDASAAWSPANTTGHLPTIGTPT
ncbi:hypothetical protein DL991_40975 [Amycolatopsis sp. WAC 01375]|uniref:GntR family transcriptional regulator n=1 Tax=Amycolatopsis sp. WAC 01375 TaxID=2203194 RepID=UPI000F790025|nr:GntR family transcriptional regulator [Amycolatopsis sp. WAC 01375]RSM68951.1 hypothetical protein DL991_40975 [Amycolatopsis sp. WAC 01375]